ncbi:HEPN domain-containing protein [Pantoea sp. CCBC3-3-1]|uniref:ApeA N-terminal domain 1-containing protein n=1 Tax=Pantoea sp. CCBC3-3-1 TaxID=2490851 RepID=UPI0011BFC7F8|nr:HEPN domain-containing protein [Pantoea sp. CCBC3-3-1]
MSTDRINLLGDYEFFGEFFPDKNTKEGRFPGVIKYTPYTGLKLEYSLSNEKSPQECERLFGILSNGKLCTLIGPFNLSSGTNYVGEFFIRTGTHSFPYAIFGDFTEELDLIEYCDFNFNGMQEFMHPQNFLHQYEFKEEITGKAESHGWEVQIRNKATFLRADKNLSNLIHSKDDDALNEFKYHFDSIREKYPQASFLLRKTLEFFFRLSKESDVTTNDIILGVIKVTSLFSILIAKPIFPEEIILKFLDEKIKSCSVLFGLGLEQRTFELAQENVSHFYTPLNLREINFETTLGKWFEIADAYKVLSISYRYETGMRTLNEAYGDIILYATLIEDINKSLGGVPKEKYEKPFNEYASSRMRSFFCGIFSKYNSDSIGDNIATLRNELAHIGRPKVLMNKLTTQEYIRIGDILRLIVTAHLFRQLEISLELIHTYMDKEIPR